MIQKKKFCLKNILKGGLPCPNAKITWIVPHSDCLTTPCDSCTDECIEITLLDDCDISCVHVRIECPDCDSCPPETHKICFCNTDGDCEVCETCSDAGVCVEKCEHCDPITGECGECSDANDCPGDLECIQGKCQCPPGTTQDGTICRECSEDGECGPCKVCTENGKCVPKDCGSGVCDPTTGDCVGCTNSGHCGPNEVCVDGECECAPGYVYDPIEGCIPAPPCATDRDCGPCMKCTEDGCVPRECPDGYVCYNDDCVKLCNCDEPSCDKVNHGCQRISSDLCACLPCDSPTDCNEIPCEDGTDCPDGWGCQNGVCVPCNSLDCSTAECDDVLGCECLGTRCVDADNKCNGTCSGPEDCGEGCGCYHGKCVACDNFDCEDCASVPGCACNENTGRCEDDGLECSDTFKINKRDDNCAIEGILITDKGCQCDRLSMGVKVQSVSPSNQFIRGINFLVELRKGDADEEGILNIPLLSQTGIANELPLSGNLQVRVVEKKRSSSYTTPVAEDVVFSQIFSLAGIDTLETGILNFNPPGFTKQDPVTGETITVGEVEIEFILKRKTLNFENSCSYSEEDSVVRYRITADGGNGFIKYSQISGGTSTFRKHEVLESASNRNPIFSWYKSTTQGNETKFRSAYATEESPGYFRDGWISVAEGVEIGKFYRLESDCACNESVFYTCPNSGAISKLRYCNPNDLTQRLVYTLSDCNKTINFNAASNTFNVCQSNSIGGQVYELHLNGQKVAEFTAANGQIVFSGSHTISTSITEIAIKLKDHACDDCYEPVELTPAEVEVEDLTYDCETETLGFSISGGSGSYSMTVDGIPQTMGQPITLEKGEHEIVFTDNNTGCTSEHVIGVDCCGQFEVGVSNSSVCSGDAQVGVSFDVTGGKAPYIYTISVGSTVVTNGVTGDESNLIALEYPGISGTYTVTVSDSRGCEKSSNFEITEQNSPIVTVGDLNYCTGDTTKEVAFTVTGSSASYAYTVRRFGESVSIDSGNTTGQFSVVVPISGSVNKFEVDVEGGTGCSTTQSFDLVFNECPNPVVEVHSGEVCEGKDASITAVITQGSGNYTWVMTHNGQTVASCNSGCGALITYNSGTEFSANTGIYNFTVTVTDSKGKIGVGNGSLVVVPAGGANCCDDSEAPNVYIDSFGGNNREVGESIILTPSNTSFGPDAYTWFEVNPSTGEFYPDPVATTVSFTPGSSVPYIRTFALRYKYEGECFAFTPNYTLTVNPEGCDCSVGIRVNSGIPSLNGKTVTSGNSQSLPNICYGDQLSFSAVTSGECPASSNITWSAFRYIGNDKGNRAQYWSGSGSSFSINTSSSTIQNSTLVVDMSIYDGTCSAQAIGFEIPLNACEQPDPFTLSFDNVPSSICEKEESNVPVVFKVHAGAKPGGGYDTFNFDWRLDKKVGNSYTSLKNGIVSGSWSGNTKTVSETINISSHISPSTGPMTLALRVRKTGSGAWTEITKQITSLGNFSTQCSECSDKNFTASVQEAPTGSMTIDKGTSINLTAVGSVSSPFVMIVDKYQWTWAGGSSTNKSISVSPQETTTYNLTITDIQGCVASTSVTVNVVIPCQDVTFNTFSWDVDDACPGDSITLTYNIGTNVGYNIYVNGSVIPTSGNSGTYTTSMITGSPMVAKVEAVYKEGCPTTVFTDTVALSPSSTCCTLPNSLVIVSEDPNLCSGDSTTYTVLVNGDDTGYTYTWYVDGSQEQTGTSKTFNFTKTGNADEVIKVEATKVGCPTREAQAIAAIKCNTGVSTITDSHQYNPGDNTITLNTFSMGVSNPCGISGINVLKARYPGVSGNPEFDLTGSATISNLGGGNYQLTATFPPNTKIPRCRISGSDKEPNEYVYLELNLTGGGTCVIDRNLGKLCNEIAYQPTGNPPGVFCGYCN